MSKGFPQHNMSVRDAGRRQILLQQATKSAANSTCFFPGCTHDAIGSHVLQERGVLDQIAENGHVMEYAPLGLFQPSRFEKAGIGSTNRLRFYGFCKDGPDHDRTIFEEIENRQCTFSTYREQLLLSYRALCNGFYQSKLISDYNNLIYNDKHISYKEKINSMGSRANSMYAHKETAHFKYLIEKELFFNSQEQKFIFYRYELPKLDIAISHIFAQAFRPMLSYEEAFALDPNSDDYQLVAPIFFVNAVPRANKLIVIIGHLQGIRGLVEGFNIETLGWLPNEGVAHFISDILVRRIDTWAISISLYERLNFQDKIFAYLKFRSDYYPEPKQRSFFKHFAKHDIIEMPYNLVQALRRADRWDIWRNVIPFNLFDGII